MFNLNLTAISNYVADVLAGREISVGEKKARWTKVKNLKPGVKIAVTNENSIDFDEVISIKKVGRERVYDIEVEGTLNFVGGHYYNRQTNKALTGQEEKSWIERQCLPRGMEQSDILYGGILAHNTYISGNVGIGITNPGTHAINVVGTAGLSTGTAWTNTSDYRFKTIDNELTGSSLEKIMALHPIAFRWNQLHNQMFGSDTTKQNFGFIAQEVQNVLPSMISQDATGYYYYNPSGFEAILTGAMQELATSTQQKIADLSTKTQDVFVNTAGDMQIVASTNTISTTGNDLTIDLSDSSSTVQGDALQAQSGFGKLLVKGNVEVTGNLIADNADINGTLSADNAEFSGNVGIGQKLTATDATISGELYADSARFNKIQANTIEGIDGIFAALSTDWLKTQNISGLEDQVIPTPAEDTSRTLLVGLQGESLPTPVAGTDPLSAFSKNPSLISENLPSVTTDIASSSADLITLASTWPVVDTNNDVILKDSIKIEKSLSVSGITVLAQTIIAGPLSQDGTLLIDNGNSINVLANTLYLQNLGGGGIDLLAGKVTITANGDATFEGNLTVKGTLFAGLISNNGKDITIGLGNPNPQEATQGLSLSTQGESLPTPAAETEPNSDQRYQPSLRVISDNNQTVFSLNAGGSGEFKGELASSGLKIVRDALASDPNDTGLIIATSSAGLAYIPEGKKEITIQSDFMTEKSLIYLTPIGSTTGEIAQVIYLARTKPAEKTFTAGVDKEVVNKMLFNWWIIN